MSEHRPDSPRVSMHCLPQW